MTFPPWVRLGRYGNVLISPFGAVAQGAEMNWKNIRLELASTEEFPAGSVSRAYLIALPLDDQDTVDEAAVVRSPNRATVRRHWSTDPDESGLVMRYDGRWYLNCDGKERVLDLDSQPVRLGTRVTVVETDGKVFPFRVASVR